MLMTADFFYDDYANFSRELNEYSGKDCAKKGGRRQLEFETESESYRKYRIACTYLSIRPGDTGTKVTGEPGRWLSHFYQLSGPAPYRRACSLPRPAAMYR